MLVIVAEQSRGSYKPTYEITRTEKVMCENRRILDGGKNRKQIELSVRFDCGLKVSNFVFKENGSPTIIDVHLMGE